MSTPIQDAAKALLQGGFSVIPVGANKKAGPWKEFQENRLPVEDVEKKFNGSTHMAIVCGSVSGNLEVVDVDDVDCWEPFSAMIRARFSTILDQLVFCKSPRGYSIAYRCETEVDGNQKLAVSNSEVDGPGIWTWNNRSDLEAVLDDGKYYIRATRLETRGNHGYYLTYPSPGYEILSGSFIDLKPISVEDRNAILAIARTFDERPQSAVVPATKKKVSKGKTIPFPGDIFSRDADFPQLLKDYGWSKVADKKEGSDWSRPGAPKKRISATLYNDGRLHVFSSNAAPLEDGKQYTAFSFYTHMEHEGNFSESTKAVAEAGYTVSLTVEELKEILEDNPDALEDAFNRSGLSEAEICAVAIDLGISLPPGKVAGRREILFSPLELSRVVEEVDQALHEVPGRWGYYHFAGRVGYVTAENQFKSYNVDNLELRIEDSCYFSSWVKSGKKSTLQGIRAPKDILTKILTYPDTRAPIIKGLAKHPTMIEGQIVGLQDGFHSGIFFKGCDRFKVDPRSFKECYDRLVELFCEDILFRDREVGQVLFISMMMTAVARLGIPGGCPGYLLTANEPGTGKSTAFEFIARTVYGTRVRSVDWGEDANERRKEIISVLRGGIECLLFDNVRQGEEVKSPILAEALTAGQFQARIMGQGEMVDVQAQVLQVFIGNNLTMSTELSRRLLTIELMANQEDPARRKVKVKNIERYCEENRVEAMGCILRLLEDGYKMDEKIDKSSGFTFWDKVVRNPLLDQTGVDILSGIDESAAGSQETANVGMLIGLLANVFGIGPTNHFTTKDVFLAIADEYRLQDDEKTAAGLIRKGIEDACRELKDAMTMVNGRAADSLKSTGHVLSELNNRISGGMKFVRWKTKSNTPVKHWIENLDVVNTEED